MRKYLKTGTALATLVLASTVAAAGPAYAQDAGNDALLKRIEQLENELNALKAMVHDNSARAEQAEVKADKARSEAATASKQAASVQPVYAEAKQSDTTWHLAGYATTGLEVSNRSDADSFVAGNFNPAFHFQYKDLVVFEGELEFELDDNETEVELEYTQIDLLLHDNVTLVIGKFLSPIGQFQERLHPSWINKMAARPVGFGHDGVQPLSDTGVQLRGGVPVGDGMHFTYAVALGNGPRMGHEGSVELEGYASDDNNNKSLGGRIGFFPLPYLEFGGSYLTAKVDGLEGTGELMPTRADFDLWGFDGAFTKGPWDVRFEYLKSKRDALNGAHEAGEEVEMLEQQDLKAWYAQAAYRLSNVSSNPIIQKLEPVIRFGQMRAEGNHELEELAQDRFNIGLNYWLAPSFVARAGLEWRDFKDEDAENERLFQLQLSYGF